jgi:hypothetical protein
MTAPLNRLQALGVRIAWGWHRHLGWPFAAGLLAAAAAAVLYLQLTPRLERERATLAQRQAARVAAASLSRSSKPIDAQDSAQAFVDSLPSSRLRSRDVAVILDAAKASNLVIERADYAVQQDPGVPITRLRASIPVKGSYGDIRALTTQVLNKLPHAALESMQLERPNAAATQLDAQLQFSLLYRTE